jgi:hypothetical protein
LTQFTAVLSLKVSHKARRIGTRSIPMMDAVMLVIAAVFFALSIGYVYACDSL